MWSGSDGELGWIDRPTAAFLVMDHGNAATAAFRTHPAIGAARAAAIGSVMATEKTEKQLKHDPPFEHYRLTTVPCLSLQ